MSLPASLSLQGAHQKIRQHAGRPALHEDILNLHRCKQWYCQNEFAQKAIVTALERIEERTQDR
jgi:hypothetical protein